MARRTPSRAARERSRLATLRALKRFEDGLEAGLSRLLHRQGLALANAYGTTGTVSQFDLLPYRAQSTALFARFYTQVATYFAEQTIASVATASAADQRSGTLKTERKASALSAAFVSSFKKWVNTQALAAAEALDTSTIARLRKLIARTISDDPQSPNLSARIADLIEDVTAEANVRQRARSIARTELHGALNYAQVETAKDVERQTGLTLQKTWCSTHDGRTRDHHRVVDGQTIGIDDLFSVGGELIPRPGTGSAHNAINCRCTLLFTEAE